MELPEQPPQGQGPDPYQAVWRMSEVSAGGGKRRTELRVVPGIIAALVVLLPFAILAGFLWFQWNVVTGGWVVLLIGLAAAFSMGAFVAADRS